MSTTNITRTAKVPIILMALLMALLTQDVWANKGRGKSNRSKDASSAQRAGKSPRQSKAPSVAPKPASPIRGTPKGSEPRQQPSQRPGITSTPARPISPPRVLQPPRPVRQPSQIQRKGEAGTGLQTYRPPTRPSGVEVRRSADIRPANPPRVIVQNNTASTSTKSDIVTRGNVLIKRPPTSKGKAVSPLRDSAKFSKADRIAKAIESPKFTLKPTQEQRRNTERTIDSGKTLRIASPLKKLSTTVSLKTGRGDKRHTRLEYTEKKAVLQNPTTVDRSSANTINSPRNKHELKAGIPTVEKRDAQKPSRETKLTGRTPKDNKWLIGRSDHDKIRLQKRDAESRTSKGYRDSGDDRPANFRWTAKGSTTSKKDFITSHRSTIQIGKGDHDFKRFRPSSTRKVIYEDRSSIINKRYHHDHVYRDRRNRLWHRIIWPRYYCPVYYNWGDYFSVYYVYPYYHRRYVFVSLGGFWPEYTCIRYHWYPCHSFWWYGYAPIAQEVQGDTYNYYTYNYYYDQQVTGTDYSSGTTGISPVDSTTFADVREKLSRQQPPAPDAQTDADARFDEGVKAFEQGSYTEAADKFADAMELAPDDIILPFAYAQTLFADGKYYQAADALRLALQKLPPDKQGVYFPRGLYLDENTLIEQIDRLAEEVETRPADSDLQLLLGYQWLGIGETEKSFEPLKKAKEDYKSFGAASVLLELAEKIKAGETQ